MAANHSSLGPFELLSGDWSSHVECAKLYFAVNDIDNAAKQRAVFLSSCGDATDHVERTDHCRQSLVFLKVWG